MPTHSPSFLEPTAERRQKALLIATIVRRSPHALPLESREENASYAHLAELCADRGIDLHLAHYDNLTGASSALAWAVRDGAWQVVDLPLAELTLCYADLPENFPGAQAFKRALEAHPITIVNALRLSDLLTDKLATHDFFAEHVPFTWRADEPDLVDQVRALEPHPTARKADARYRSPYGRYPSA